MTLDILVLLLVPVRVRPCAGNGAGLWLCVGSVRVFGGIIVRAIFRFC